MIEFTEAELQTEFWKEIEGYEGSYQVSSLGRVKSFKGRNKDGRILKGSPDGKGYLRVNLFLDGKQKNVRIHRLVCEAFCVREQSHFNTCDHIDGDRLNNRCENLRWTTNKGNHNNRKDNNEHIGVSWCKAMNKFEDLFYEMYDDAVKGKNSYRPSTVYWWQIPNRDRKWAE